jgi:competence protein ComEC
MRNLTFYGMTALILGILTEHYGLLTLKMAIALSPILLVCLWKMRGRKNQVIIFLIVSFFIYGIFSYRYYAYNPFEEYYGHEARISGTILEVQINKEESQYQSFVLDASVNIGPEMFYEKMIVYVREKEGEQEGITGGMSIDGFGEMIEPSKATNFEEFDYKEFLNIKGIKGIIFLDEVDVHYDSVNYFGRIQNAFVSHIEKLIDANLGYKEASLLKGIILGNSDYIDDQVLDNIRRLGIAHVVAVSGLHVGIILASFGFIFALLKIRRRHSIVIGLLLIWLYGAMIGFPVSVTRALIMCSFVYTGILFHRRYDFFYSIMLSALFMLMHRPLWLFDIAFQLSFTAVVAVAYFQTIRFKDNIYKWVRGVYFLICIQIFITPISIYYFNYVPLLSIASNLIFVPAITLVIFLTIVSLGLSPFLSFFSEALLYFVNQVLKLMIYISGNFLKLPVSGINVSSPSVFEMVMYYLLLLLVVQIIQYKNECSKLSKIYAVCFMSIGLYCLMFVTLPAVLDQNLYISIIDVGQGSAAFIRNKDTCFMIDAGGSVSLNYERADYVLPSYLSKRGIFDLDCIFLTHYHSDHYSGIDKINEKTTIEGIVSGYNNPEILKGFGDLKFYKINQGDYLKMRDDFIIKVLWPRPNFISIDENRNSLVLLLEFNGFKALFTGDIDHFVEKEIEASLPVVDVLIVPHHGSSTASGEDFVKQTYPSFAIFSYGENSYGIPSKEVIDRYLDAGINVLSTYENGEIIVSINKNGDYTITCYNGDIDMNVWEIFISSILLVLFARGIQSSKRSDLAHEL